MARRERHRQVVADPRQGGQLVTDLSLDHVGLHNYARKSNFRRVLDGEARCEGHDYFWPNTSGAFATDPGNQPFPNNVTAESIASLTRSGSVATVTFNSRHRFTEGETVAVSGLNQSAYNVTAQIRNVTRTSFQYDVSGSPASPATGGGVVKSAMPLNLVHRAMRQNGKRAVIVGTATRLFRFFAQENGAYFEATGTDAPYFATSGTNLPYFNDNPGEWLEIGHGFSVNGARWEAHNLNGYAILNNGVDLPVTYRLEDDEVEPVWELRENGVAAVGTICVYNGALMCADISQIKEGRLEELFQLIGDESGGEVLASQSGTTATASEPFFSAADVGRWIVYESGETAKITAYTDPGQVAVGTSQTVDRKLFKTRVKAAQAGAVFSGSTTGTLNHTTMILGTSATVSVAVGDEIRFTNGFRSVVVSVLGPTSLQLTLADDPGENIVGLPFWIVNTAARTVVAESTIFTGEMVGRSVSWDSGATRIITGYVNATTVVVDEDLTVDLGFFGVENPDTYARRTDSSELDRIQYRVMWSALEEPRRFSASAPATIEAGSNRLEFAYPVRSFESGQAVLILGAGVNGGNLTATILSFTADRVATLDVVAETGVVDALVSRSDAVGSIAGYADLEDDGSPVLRMLPLGQWLVLYKDTTIFMASYRGTVDSPFDFSRQVKPDGKTLYYRNTLVNISGEDGEFHVYAGRKAFYRFDLTTLRPREVQQVTACGNLFYDHASLEDTQRIWAANNSITQEVWVGYPVTGGADGLMRLDYRGATVGTGTAELLAGGMVSRPETGTSTGETEDWFLVGVAGGVVLVNGIATEPVASWGAVKSIFYRRQSNPYSSVKSGYTSELWSGANDFGDPDNEKEVVEYVPLLSSRSPDCPLTVSIYSGRNTAEGLAALTGFPHSLTSPATENQIPMYFMDNYFQERVSVSGMNNPCVLARRVWRVGMVNSQSAIRGET